MKTVRILMVLTALTLLGALSPLGALGSPAVVNVNIGVFHDSLAPYGTWIETPRYGWVWEPRHVAYGWRPYTRGYWAFTDDGWAWISTEPWGWATYHYGRWYPDPVYGWVWVPGRVWAPAWVAWRYGGGVIGWAPLPPAIGYDFVGLDFDDYIAPSAFVFVGERYFIERDLVGYILPVRRNVGFMRVTRNITRYGFVGGRYVNHGVSVERIKRVAGRDVRRFRIRDAGSVKEARRIGAKRNEMAFFRPNVRGGKHDAKRTSFTRSPKEHRSGSERLRRQGAERVRTSRGAERNTSRRLNARRGESSRDVSVRSMRRVHEGRSGISRQSHPRSFRSPGGGERRGHGSSVMTGSPGKGGGGGLDRGSSFTMGSPGGGSGGHGRGPSFGGGKQGGGRGPKH